MAEYTIYKAEGKIAQKHLDAAYENFLALKGNIATMKKAEQKTFMHNTADFKSNKQGLFFGDNVFLWGDRVLFDGSKGNIPPKGFTPVAEDDTKKLFHASFSLS